MIELFFQTLWIIITSGKKFYLLTGSLAILVGAALLATRDRGGLILGGPLVAVGVVLILISMALRTPRGSPRDDGAAAPPDTWRPPEATEVRETIGGK